MCDLTQKWFMRFSTNFFASFWRGNYHSNQCKFEICDLYKTVNRLKTWPKRLRRKNVFEPNFYPFWMMFNGPCDA
jgi:hypothetical protein